jgi:hypothetical protein
MSRPVLFNVETGRRIVVPSDLSPTLTPLTDLFWREDSRAFTFEYNQRGHASTGSSRVDGRPACPGSDFRGAGTFFNTYAAATGPKDSGTYFRRDVNDGLWNFYGSPTRRFEASESLRRPTGRKNKPDHAGEWVVRGVVDVDENAPICFVAGGIHPGEDPYFRHLCRSTSTGRI